MSLTGSAFAHILARFQLQPSSGEGGGEVMFPQLVTRPGGVYGYGTGAGRFNRGYYHNSTRTGGIVLSSTTARSIDLQTTTDRFGVALGLTSVRFLGIAADLDNLYDIAFKPNGTNGWAGAISGATTYPFADASDIFYIRPGMILVFDLMSAPNGFTVDATHKVLDLANASSSTQNYEILVLGQA